MLIANERRGSTRIIWFILISFVFHVTILYLKVKGSVRPDINHAIQITIGGTAFASLPRPRNEPVDRSPKKAAPKRLKATETPSPQPKKRVKKQVVKKRADTSPKESPPLESTQDHVIKGKRPPPGKHPGAKEALAERHPPQKAESPREERPHKAHVASLVKKELREAKGPREVAQRDVPPSPPQKKTSYQEDRKRPGASIQQKGLKNYLSRVRLLIEAHKYYPYNARVFGREGKVQVAFTIDRAGNIKGATITGPCKYKDLNRAALKTLHSSSPLPPPPSALSPPLKVSLTLVFRLDDRRI